MRRRHKSLTGIMAPLIRILNQLITPEEVDGSVLLNTTLDAVYMVGSMIKEVSDDHRKNILTKNSEHKGGLAEFYKDM